MSYGLHTYTYGPSVCINVLPNYVYAYVTSWLLVALKHSDTTVSTFDELLKVAVIQQLNVQVTQGI